MQVVGTTTQQEIWVASRERKFIINEILVIEDAYRNFPRGEVVETSSFNRYIPLVSEQNSLVDERVLEGLRAVGYDPREEEINLAKVRIMGEITTPVTVGAAVRLPAFEEVENLLVRQPPENGLTLGVIRGTESLAAGLPGHLKDILCLYMGEGGIAPQTGVPFIFDYKSMNEYPHIGIFGGSGSGKSFGLRVLLEELMVKKVPCVVLDPHYEMDFSVPFSHSPSGCRHDFTACYRIFTVGLDAGVNFVELTARDLVSLLGFGEPLSEAMANAVFTLHSYRDSLQSFSTKLHGMIEVMEEEKNFRRNPQSIPDPHERARLKMLHELSDKFKDRVGHLSSLKAVAWRLNSVVREGLFTSDTAQIEDVLKARKTAVIRGPVRLLQVYGAYLFDHLYKKRREFRDARQKDQPAEYFPPFVLVTDEAHNFCPRGERDSFSKRVTKLIAQEGRKYGVNLILASQRIALLEDTVTAQLNTKLIFRTVRAMDISTIKEETDLGQEETNRLPYLGSGNCFVSSAITGRAVPVRIRCAWTKGPYAENPFDELEREYWEEEDKFWSVVGRHLPFGIYELHVHGPQIAAELGQPITNEEIVRRMQELVRRGVVKVEKSILGDRYTI